MKYIIDGRFLYGQVLGVQRYAREITQKLDGMVKDKPYDVEIAVPEIDSEGTSAEINSYKTKYDNIKIVILKGRAGRKWGAAHIPALCRQAEGKTCVSVQ